MRMAAYCLSPDCQCAKAIIITINITINIVITIAYWLFPVNAPRSSKSPSPIACCLWTIVFYLAVNAPKPSSSTSTSQSSQFMFFLFVSKTLCLLIGSKWQAKYSKWAENLTTQQYYPRCQKISFSLNHDQSNQFIFNPITSVLRLDHILTAPPPYASLSKWWWSEQWE